LPAEATTSAPDFTARPIASRISVVSEQATMEMLMIWLLSRTARSIARTRVFTVPSESSGRSECRYAVTTAPGAMVPATVATAVPCRMQ